MKDRTAEECFFGSVTVGERGQVVIPADARKELGIEAGDRLLAFRVPNGNGIVLSKLEGMHELVRYFQRMIDRINEASEEDSFGEGD